MTISSITGKTAGTPLIKTGSKPDSAGKVQAISAGGASDAAEQIAVAKQINKVFQSSPVDATIDYERVAAVKKALTEGSYVIDPERIAKKMIEFEKPPSKNSA
jgi:negative regulator of flagellin synthesis FlgM